MAVGNVPAQVVHVEHDPGDPELLVDPLDHVVHVDRLVGTTDEIAVQVHIQVMHTAHERQRLVSDNIVHIKRMLRQLQPAQAQAVSAVDHAVHEEELADPEKAHVIPGETAVDREDIAVRDDVGRVVVFVLVDVIGNDQVERRVIIRLGPQQLHHLGISRLVKPVIAVDHFEIASSRDFKPLVDRRSMATIRLLLQTYDIRIALDVVSRDLRSPVRGTIVDNDHLDIRPSCDQRVQTGRQVIL